MFAISARLLDFAYWLLNTHCVTFLQCAERLVQYGPGHPHDAMGQDVHSASSGRRSARVRMDGELGEPDALGHTAGPRRRGDGRPEAISGGPEVMARGNQGRRDDVDVAGCAAVQLLLHDLYLLVPVLFWVPGQVVSQDKGRRGGAIGSSM